MTTTHIILAHPEPLSFTGQWAAASEQACRSLGMAVTLSDLVADNFDPVERAKHYGAMSEPFDPLRVQEKCSVDESLPADVMHEIVRVEAAERLIFHFPLWWFGAPAVLKGWFDRVLAHGRMHTIDERFDTGRFGGKTAMFCVSTGCEASECGIDGKEGNVRLQLWPLAYALRYCGFDIVEPLLVHSVHSYHEDEDKALLEQKLAEVLRAQADVIGHFDQLPRMRFNSDKDFDDQGRLQADADVFSPFIQRRTS